MTLTGVSPTDCEPIAPAPWNDQFKASASAHDEAPLSEEAGRRIPRTCQGSLKRPPQTWTDGEGYDPQNDTHPLPGRGGADGLAARQDPNRGVLLYRSRTMAARPSDAPGER
jgi:hypothetical protein